MAPRAALSAMRCKVARRRADWQVAPLSGHTLDCRRQRRAHGLMKWKVLMLRRDEGPVSIGIALCFVLAVACSSPSPDGRSGASSANAGSGGAGAGEKPDAATAPIPITAAATDNPTPLGGGNGAAGGHGGASAANSGDAGLPACVSAVQEGQRVPIDMMIMLDRSGSMLETTGAGPTKWDATLDALNKFLSDSRSDGLGIGLQYFPLGQCSTDSDCGANGPCVNRFCEPPSFGTIDVTRCLTVSDCPIRSPGCAPAGTCSSDDTLLCFQLGTNGCGRGDTCEPLEGQCNAFPSCDAASYNAAEVPIMALPQNAPALMASLAAGTPRGLNTPTYAALSGAIEQAAAQAKAHTDHRVVTVLATDGLPEGCQSNDSGMIGDAAKLGLLDTPSISTYVVGTVAPTDADSQTNLTAWAKAGGTDTPFIVDPSQDVSAQFLDALDKIRNGAIACDYLLPPDPKGSQLDFNMVNVALVEGSNTRDFLYVGDESRCNLATLGWHYDIDPTAGRPTKIVACASACDMLKTTDNGKVEIRLGCQTMGPE
jgi:hypothetical protein